VDVAGRHRRELGRAPATGLPPPPAQWDEARRSRVLRGFGVFVDVALAMADDLLALARDWRPDLVVFDPLSYAGPLVARLIGVPAVRNLFGPDITLDLEYEALPPLLDRYGVDELDIYGALTVDPCPPSLQLPSPRPRQHMRYVPYSGLSAVPPWVARQPERPRICLTWGTSTTRLDAQYTSCLPDILAGLSDVDAEVVLAVTSAERRLLGELPDGVRLAESVPLAALLPTCAAVIHQGGAGTTLTSVLCGLPQLVIAQIADQLVTAYRVAETGIGRYLIPAEGLAGRVRAEATEILGEPSYRHAAGAMRAEMLAQPTPQSVVAVLAQLARDGDPDDADLVSAGGAR